MIRASLGNREYWEEWINYGNERRAATWARLKAPSENPNYRPQYAFDTGLNAIRLLLCKYSRGDRVGKLDRHFIDLIDAWELSNKLAVDLNGKLLSGEGWDHRHSGTAPLVTSDPRGHVDPRLWIFDLSDLNHYTWCFWLVGLALALDITDDQWSRLLLLIDGEGRDALLDRVIASRQPGRIIGKQVLHPKPYARLVKAIDAPQAQQAALLLEFVDHWYAELARKGKDELWWYVFGDPVKQPLSTGSYFGRWCIEAVAAVKAFGIDDSLCLGHENYPGDLLRPDGPSTHVLRAAATTSWFGKLLRAVR